MRAAVLFPTIALRSPDNNPPSAAMATRRAFNSWLADFCAYEPARLKLNAAIPLLDIDAAVAELRRVKTLGAVSFMPDPRPDGAAEAVPTGGGVRQHRRRAGEPGPGGVAHGAGRIRRDRTRRTVWDRLPAPGVQATRGQDQGAD